MEPLLLRSIVVADFCVILQLSLRVAECRAVGTFVALVAAKVAQILRSWSFLLMWKCLRLLFLARHSPHPARVDIVDPTSVDIVVPARVDIATIVDIFDPTSVDIIAVPELDMGCKSRCRLTDQSTMRTRLFKFGRASLGCLSKRVLGYFWFFT